MPAAIVDGNDLWAVTEAAQEAVDHARAGGGPTLLECRPTAATATPSPTRRLPARGGARALAGARPDQLTRARLLDEGIAEDAIAAVEQQVRAELDHAVAAALAAPYPDPRRRRATEFAP